MLLTSCAAHSPMSETVIFAPKKIDGEKIEATHQIGFSFSTDILDTETLYPDQMDSHSGYNNGLYNPNEFSFHNTLYLKQDNNHFAAISFSAGTGAGFDATARIIDPVYVTVGYSNVGQYEISLPVRIHHSEKIGFLAAPVYRNQIVYRDNQNENPAYFDFIPENKDSYKTAGVKSSFYLLAPAIKQETRRLHYGIKLEGGMILDPKAWYFSFGIRLGGY